MAGARINVALLGLGTIGTATAQFLFEKPEVLAQHVGQPVVLKRVLVRDPDKERTVSVDARLLTTRLDDILDDPEIAIVVELVGGDVGLDLIEAAVRRCKAVVTANKDVMAKHGSELLDLAHANGVEIRYEASVGGGIPLIGPFQQTLVANHISRITAIINGTTNYILTRMAEQGTSFGAALKEAQGLGYAEPNPRNDVEGFDAAYKLAILSSLAFHARIRPDDIYREGITTLDPRDFRYARELGFNIKLLAIGREQGGCVEVRVHPALVPENTLLAQVKGVFNAVQVEGDLMGPVILYGRGAGPGPTSGVVIADIIELAKSIALGTLGKNAPAHFSSCQVRPMSDVSTRYYLRMKVADRAGVLAQVARVLGEQGISIASVVQKDSDEATRTAEPVIMTHTAKESAMVKALETMRKLEVVKEIGSLLRVEI